MIELQFHAARTLAAEAAPVATAGFNDDGFADQLLAALAAMAARSKRGQADLAAALRGAGIVAEPRRVRAALRLLHARGAVQDFVPLSDGGMLLTVAAPAPRPRGAGNEWSPFDAEEARAR